MWKSNRSLLNSQNNRIRKDSLISKGVDLKINVFVSFFYNYFYVLINKY